MPEHVRSFEHSFSRDFLGRGQQVCDGIGVEIALVKRRRVSGISQLA
jgi:hypothetical protein